MASIKTYQQGVVPACPHCGKSLEDPVEDHVIPGKTGAASASTSECGHCYKEYTAWANEDGTFSVEAGGLE